MSTVQIPSDASIEEANRTITNRRLIDDEMNKSEKEENKRFYIYNGILVVMIHLFIFNALRNFIFNNTLQFWFYSTVALLEVGVLIGNFYLKDYGYTKMRFIIIVGFFTSMLLISSSLIYITNVLEFMN